ncbi:unnamed protein product [Brassicogethes aeneus]|uniref:Uncharacterized protein n=1 Tax=Brassicogethes aeneus TaxID=1431903 RepID=A0A9P0BIR9_BRAAE|nr:unnamed protein product [Brassicogethes aeneus]
MVAKSVVLEKIVCLLLLIGNVYGETYENSKTVCQKCVCTQNDPTFSINCNEKGLNHVLANWPKMADSTKAITASFSKNSIDTLEKLPGTDKVVEVVFTYCNIQKVNPEVFTNVPKIKYVDLSHNKITSEELSPEDFRGTYVNDTWQPLDLLTLNLAYNEIHMLQNNIFEFLPKLEELNLKGNNFRVLDEATQLAIDSLKNLLRLNLADNKLTEITSTTIMNLTNLVELDLSYNKLDFVPAILSEISQSLENLILDGNPIFELTDSSFINTKNLIQLSMNNMNRLDNILPNAFAPLKKLRTLKLSNNPLLEELDAQTFPEHPDLAEVYLNNNSFDDISFELLEWSKLKIFEFKGNPLKCSCNLFKIHEKLSKKITRQQDGPICMDLRVVKSRPVFYLTDDICRVTPSHMKKEHVSHSFNVLRITIIAICTLLLLATLGVAATFLFRWRRIQRNLNYPFVSEVRYNPVNIHGGFN